MGKTFLFSLAAACGLALMLPAGSVHAHESAEPDEPPRHWLEASFGASLLFVEQPLEQQSLFDAGDTRVLPVPSVLFLGEVLLTERFSAGAFLNLPVQPVRRLEVDGTVSEDAVAAAIALGGAWNPVRVQVFRTATFRTQIALFLGHTIRSTQGDVFFPTAAVRAHLATQGGFTMYVGGSYSGRRDTIALIYGVGHRF